MDILTHGMMGVILAGPLLSAHPLAASLFILGNAVPDLDACARLFGKRMFLLFHQTWSHALPIIWSLGSLLSLYLYMNEYADWYSGFFLALGMSLHSLTDVSNTYGIKIFAPFSNKRYCLEWVFFIDSVTLLMSIPLFIYTVICILDQETPAAWISLAYLSSLTLYWLTKCFLRKRLRNYHIAGAQSFIPSALIPWHFFTSILNDNKAELLKLSALNGQVLEKETVNVYDAEWKHELESNEEYHAMRQLSSAYHLTQVKCAGDNVHLSCQDLRTRNFKTRFGSLELVYSKDRELIAKDFHV